jgi:hypothetical protein
MDFLGFADVPHSSTPPLGGMGGGMGGQGQPNRAPMGGGMGGGMGGMNPGRGAPSGGRSPAPGGGLDGFDAFSGIGGGAGQQYNRGGRR